jgi:hypothetical protein
MRDKNTYVTGLYRPGDRCNADPVFESTEGTAGASSRRWLPLRPGWRFVAVLVLLGLVLQAGLLVALRLGKTVELLEADEHEYWTLATTLLQGSLGEFPARRTLGFPLVIAAIRRVVGDGYFAVQTVLSTLLCLMAPLTYYLVRSVVGSERAARLAALGVLFWPSFLWLGVTLYSDVFTLLVFLVYLNAVPPPWLSQDPTRIPWRRWLLAGGLLGLCMHFRPMYLLYAPIGFLLAVWNSPGWRTRLASGALLTMGCLATVLPWSTYLSLREGQFALLCTNDGATLSGGLNATLYEMERMEVSSTKAGRPTWVGPGAWVPPYRTGFLTDTELATLNETELNRLLMQRTGQWIQSHPRETAFLTLMKLAYMWGIYPFWWSIYPFWVGLARTLLGNCLVLLLIAASLASVVKFRRWLPILALFWTLPLFASLVACVSLGNWRYRVPGDLGLIVLTALLLSASELRRALQRQSPAAQHEPQPSPYLTR